MFDTARAFQGQTVSVVDRSGHVVRNVGHRGLSCATSSSCLDPSTKLTYLQSKHLLDVFREARAAYRRRKSEIFSAGSTPRTPPPPYRSQPASPTRSRSYAPSRSPSYHRRRSSADYSSSSKASSVYPESHARHAHDTLPLRPAATRSVTSPTSPNMQLARRHTSLALAPRPRPRSPDLDDDLAYGPIPASLLSSPANAPAVASRIQSLLVEADCLRASATATIAHLHRHPDAMAAVALSLAELSAMLSKASPGVLGAVRGASPAVWALLASPQFAIALGLGVGVTVVVLGGWRIVKRNRAKKAAEQTGFLAGPSPRAILSPDDDPDAARLEVGGMTGIETWRRGVVADPESVDAELVSPAAAALVAWDPSRDLRRSPSSPRRPSAYDVDRSPDRPRHRRRASDGGLSRADSKTGHAHRRPLPRSATFYDGVDDREKRGVREREREGSVRSETSSRSTVRRGEGRERRDREEARDGESSREKGKGKERVKPKPSPLRMFFS